MAPTRLRIERVGQLKDADVTFGDLTVLVGPQATGKSIFLQFLKLLVDAGPVLSILKQYGLDWDRMVPDFLDVFFGEGMRRLWDEKQSKLTLNGQAKDLNQLVGHQKKSKIERLFFIPAQRVLTLGKGWPRPFADYSPGDPFCVRDFSEKLRVQMESGLGRGDVVFPEEGRLKKAIRDLLVGSLFTKFNLRVDRHGAQKRLVLSAGDPDSPMPFMVARSAAGLPTRWRALSARRAEGKTGFRAAVLATEGLEDAYRTGLNALNAGHKRRIRCRRPNDLAGSVDIDDALLSTHPDSPRWDYGIGVRAQRRHDLVAWVEVHPASSSNVSEVLRKLEWLKQWLRTSAPRLNQLPAGYSWIATDGVHIQAGSRQWRQLAQAGLSPPRQVLVLPC
jgi:hypothetical protein